MEEAPRAVPSRGGGESEPQRRPPRTCRPPTAPPRPQGYPRTTASAATLSRRSPCNAPCRASRGQRRGGQGLLRPNMSRWMWNLVISCTAPAKLSRTEGHRAAPREGLPLLPLSCYNSNISALVCVNKGLVFRHPCVCSCHNDPTHWLLPIVMKVLSSPSVT